MDNTTWIAFAAFVAGASLTYMLQFVKGFFPDDLRVRLKNVKVMLKLAWIALISDGRSFPVTVTTIMREESDALLPKKEIAHEQASEPAPAHTTH